MTSVGGTRIYENSKTCQKMSLDFEVERQCTFINLVLLAVNKHALDKCDEPRSGGGR